MGKWIDLSAADGVTIAGYRADPAGKPRGGSWWSRKSSASTRTSATYATVCRRGLPGGGAGDLRPGRAQRRPGLHAGGHADGHGHPRTLQDRRRCSPTSRPRAPSPRARARVGVRRLLLGRLPGVARGGAAARLLVRRLLLRRRHAGRHRRQAQGPGARPLRREGRADSGGGRPQARRGALRASRRTSMPRITASTATSGRPSIAAAARTWRSSATLAFLREHVG